MQEKLENVHCFGIKNHELFSKVYSRIIFTMLYTKSLKLAILHPGFSSQDFLI